MFKVGDEVEVVNNDGGNKRTANIGDRGIIAKIKGIPEGRKGIITIKRDSDKKLIAMYPFRFKKIKKINREEIIYE